MFISRWRFAEASLATYALGTLVHEYREFAHGPDYGKGDLDQNGSVDGVNGDESANGGGRTRRDTVAKAGIHRRRSGGSVSGGGGSGGGLGSGGGGSRSTTYFSNQYNYLDALTCVGYSGYFGLRLAVTLCRFHVDYVAPFNSGSFSRWSAHWIFGQVLLTFGDSDDDDNGDGGGSGGGDAIAANGSDDRTALAYKLDYVALRVLALTAIVLWLRLTHLSSASPRLGPVVSALWRVGAAVATFFVILIVVTMAFVALFVAWFGIRADSGDDDGDGDDEEGSTLAEFGTLYTGLFTLLRALFGDFTFDFSEIADSYWRTLAEVGLGSYLSGSMLRIIRS